MIVLSHVTVVSLIQARAYDADSAVATLDLGLSETTVELTESGVTLPDGQVLKWETIEEIARSEKSCFQIQDGQAEKIQTFSTTFERFYSLYPTSGAPTMLAAGFPMHRIKNTDPRRDTLLKVKTIAPIIGDALDTCTGLGYTAIEMARTAGKVMTIELDPAVHEICARNPWSRELFTNPRIERMIGNSFDLVAEMPDESFARIMHDPPTIQLAGELYSGEMYHHLFRVLKRGGRLFHYIGDLDSARGRSLSRGAALRLQDAGFSRVTRRPEAFGFLARK